MKRVLLIIITFFAINVTFAQQDNSNQNDDELKTIFGKSGDKVKVSGFGAFNMDFGSIENNFGLMLGGEGAVLINRSFFVGLYGRGLTTLPLYTYTYYSSNGAKNIEIMQRGAFGHGGLLIGYVFAPTKPIHLGISARIGAGGIGLIDDYSSSYYDPNHSYYYNYPYVAPLLVLSPQLDLEMNLTNWFKFRISAGYQYVTDATLNVQVLENGKLVEKELFNTSGYNTPTFSLGFVFGWFK
jgi:hypothetical protein